MIVLFTDFGSCDPYVGQVKAVLARAAPSVPVIDLLHGAPDFNAHAGAQLLDALCCNFPEGSVFFCVVDPGVGGPRQAVVVEADGRWFVGPDNGLLSVLAARAGQRRYWRIHWRQEGLSDTFPTTAICASCSPRRRNTRGIRPPPGSCGAFAATGGARTRVGRASISTRSTRCWRT